MSSRSRCWRLVFEFEIRAAESPHRRHKARIASVRRFTTDASSASRVRSSGGRNRGRLAIVAARTCRQVLGQLGAINLATILPFAIQSASILLCRCRWVVCAPANGVACRIRSPRRNRIVPRAFSSANMKHPDAIFNRRPPLSATPCWRPIDRDRGLRSCEAGG